MSTVTLPSSVGFAQDVRKRSREHFYADTAALLPNFGGFGASMLIAMDTLADAPERTVLAYFYVSQ